MPKIRICSECNGKTNNPDKKGMCPFCSKKKRLDWKDCICNLEEHSATCRNNHRKNYIKYWSIVVRKKFREQLRKEHRCIWCKKKVKPKITYPQFCEKHNQKNRQLEKERKRE